MQFGQKEKLKNSPFLKSIIVFGVTVLVNMLVKKALESLLRKK